MTRPIIAPQSAEGLVSTLAAAIDGVSLPAVVEQSLTSRLLGRIAASAAAHGHFATIRRADVHWQDAGEHAQLFELHSDEVARTRLWRLRPGAQVNLAGLGGVSEWLILNGDVAFDLPDQGRTILRSQGYALWGAGSPLVSVTTEAGALIYERCSRSGSSAFADSPQGSCVQCDEHGEGPGWEPLRQGVWIRPLHAVDDRISMLVRFEPGASVPAHPHSVGEECLMVRGDLFLGDVLLREGEFQFAPLGSGHGELMSDVGCVLFFHGAIDPAAVDPAVRGGY